MEYQISNKYSWLLTLAFFISSILVSNIYHQRPKCDTSFKPTWTAKAAAEAEAMAAVNCSGHGRTYLDRRSGTGIYTCYCNNCYKGPDCSEPDPDHYCTADVVTGDAMFLEKYWLQDMSRSAVLIPGWHRMSYYYQNPLYHHLESTLLEDRIKYLHQVVGNAKVNDKHVVFGNGVTQLLTGLVIVLSQHRASKPVKAKIVAEVPYYPVFKKQTKYFRYEGYEWKGNATDYIHTENPQDFIELVTSPNNPDGNLKVAQIRGAQAIYDRVYYWPHYTAIRAQPADEDIMLFSLSKLTGHAGSRFGWALMRDRELADKLEDYMIESSEGSSHDTQVRVLAVVEEIEKYSTSPRNGNNIFKIGYETMKSRWEKLYFHVSNSPFKRFSLQKLDQEQDCYYMKKKRYPTPAFGWLKCEWEEDKNCTAVLEDGQILTQGGELFDASIRYARLSLIKTDDDFDQMMVKLRHLLQKKREV